jgi:opacity protein-like surface antigen
MKSKIAISLIVSIFGLTNAQAIHSYGFKGGFAQTSQTWNYSHNSFLYGLKVYDKPRVGIDIGGFIEWFNMPFISVVTEIHYIQKGSTDEFIYTTAASPDGTGGTMIIDPRIDYLSFPMFGKLRLETPIITLYGIAGPRIDFIIGHNNYATGAVFDDLKSPEFGLTIGAGLEYPIFVAYKVGVEYRYSYSPQYAYSNQHLTVKNNSMEFILLIGF